MVGCWSCGTRGSQVGLAPPNVKRTHPQFGSEDLCQEPLLCTENKENAGFQGASYARLPAAFPAREGPGGLGAHPDPLARSWRGQVKASLQGGICG